MKSTLLRLSMTIAISLAATTLSSAQVQEHLPIRVKIPFEFIAGQSTLPPGDYTVSPIFTDMEIISGKGGHVVTMAPPMLEGTAGTIGLLIFHQLGDKYVLAEVWPAGSKRGRVIGGSNTLKRRMNAELTSQVTVIAGQRH